MRYLALLPLLVLAACGTPQERCARDLNREGQRLSALIAETEDNIARGYRYETEVRDVTFGVTYCNRSRNVGVCLDNRPETRRRAVAIDPQAEARKLESLKIKRNQLARTQCTAAGQPQRF